MHAVEALLLRDGQTRPGTVSPHCQRILCRVCHLKRLLENLATSLAGQDLWEKTNLFENYVICDSETRRH